MKNWHWENLYKWGKRNLLYIHVDGRTQIWYIDLHSPDPETKKTKLSTEEEFHSDEEGEGELNTEKI